MQTSTRMQSQRNPPSACMQRETCIVSSPPIKGKRSLYSRTVRVSFQITCLLPCPFGRIVNLEIFRMYQMHFCNDDMSFFCTFFFSCVLCHCCFKHLRDQICVICGCYVWTEIPYNKLHVHGRIRHKWVSRRDQYYFFRFISDHHTLVSLVRLFYKYVCICMYYMCT